MDKEFIFKGKRAIIKFFSILAISLLLASIVTDYTNVYLSVGFKATDFFRLMEIYTSSLLSSCAGLLQLIGIACFTALFFLADRLADKIDGQSKIVSIGAPVVFAVCSIFVLLFDLFYWIVNIVSIFPKIGSLFENIGRVSFLDGYYNFVEIFGMITSCLILLLGVCLAVFFVVKVYILASDDNVQKSTK